MNAEDYRIGNYLLDREDRLCQVEELSCREGEREVYAPAIIGGLTSLPNKPIPLTEEWLLKFGFGNSKYRKGYIGRIFKGGGMFLDFVLHKPLEKGPWNENFTFDLPHHRYVDIPYVHQLQNLFHSVTGEELKANQ